MTGPGAPGRAVRVALALGAALGTACLLAGLAALAFDLRPLVFRSGSMAPTINTGDLAIARSVPAADLAVADVVSVMTASGVRVTHRVVAVTPRGAGATLALKGDANAAVDAEVYQVPGADRVLFSIPRGGYVVAWLAGPFGMLLVGGYVVWLLPRVLRPPVSRPGGSGAGRGGRRRAPTERRRRHHPATAALTVTAILGLLSVTGSPQERAPWTLAAWTDAVSVTGTQVGAYTVPVPATFTCGSLGVLSVTFNWAAVTGATNYTLHYGNAGAQTLTTAATTATITSAISGGTAWVVANRVFGPVTWSSVASTTRSYNVAVVSLCS